MTILGPLETTMATFLLKTENFKRKMKSPEGKEPKEAVMEIEMKEKSLQENEIPTVIPQSV